MMKIKYLHRLSLTVLSLAAGLSFLIPVHAQTTEPTQGIILYEDRDYGGASWSVGEGTFGTVELDASGVGNNRASSLKVAQGYQVQLCDGPVTDCVAFSNSIARLGSDLENRVSNLIVGKTSFGAMQAEVATLARHVRGETNLSEQALQDLRDRIVNDVSYGAAGRDRDLVARAYETVQSYESIHGPLFTDEGTKTFRRDDSLTDGRALERVMQIVYLIAFDGVNAANLAAAPRFIGGMVFRSHEYFPGAVPKPANPSAVYQMRIDASVPEDWGRPNLYSIIPARRPTGAYVAPGTIGEVTVPARLVNKGYQIRVGAHSWNLAVRPNQRRLARVSNLFPITSTTTKFANPMGGNVYIEVPYLANDGLVDVQFKNTIRAPFYSQRHFHKMSPAAWAVEKTHPGPFADMESERSMLSIPSKWVRGDYDVEAVLEDEDDMANAMSQFMGKPEIRNKTINFRQVDVDLRSAFRAPGYPMSDFSNFDLDEANGIFLPRDFPDETIMHEMGHATLALFFKDESEAIVHMPMVLLLNKVYGMSLQRAFSESIHRSLGEHVTLTDAFNSWALTDSFLAGEDAVNRQLGYNYAGIGNYMDIVELFGWEAIIATNRDISQHWVEFGDAIPRVFHEHGADDRMLRLSRATGVDIRPIIHLWGKQPIDPQALAADLQAEGLLPSSIVYDRLIEHRRHIPENQAEFDHFWSQVGEDVAFYPEWGALRDNYDPARGTAAANRINQLIALYFPNGRPQAIDAVTVFQDDGFTGIRANLDVGTYNFVDLEALGVGNDDISSIQVRNGFSVYACAHTTTESCRTISASTAALGELNNSISSIEVRRSTGSNPTTNPTNPVPTATVYGNNNFGGFGVDLPVGIYTLPELESLRIGNDAISSIQVSNGYTVYACAHRASDGTCKSFSAPAPTLGSLNNQISYLEVSRSTTTETTVTVYGDSNYGGSNVNLAVGAYTLTDLESLGISNDSISSIQLHNGYSAYACQHGVGGGVCRRYTESTPTLGVLNNAISYIEVSRASATVYSDNNYGGNSAGLPVGVYSISALESLGVGNDAISSIQVQSGFAVYACSDVGGNGRCESYVNSTSALGAMNDVISYIEVVDNLRIARAQIDTDSDGISDVIELAENTDPNDAGSLLDTNKNGTADINDADSDNDGIWNENEHGGAAYYDRDRDGVPAYLDDNDYNDAIGNDDNAVQSLFDPDRNGIASFQEAPASTLDFDKDQVPDHIEEVEGTDPTDATSFSDFDQDNVPDYIDTDDDNDGIPDNIEGSADADGDSIPNYRDSDSDGDGTPDLIEGMTDVDGNLIPNFLDDATQHTVPVDDQDNDGIADAVEGAWDADLDGIANLRDTDSDNDAIPDSVETNADLDGDRIPNFLDTDTDGDSILDLIEGNEDVDGDSLGNFIDQDSDADTIPDSVETDADLDGDGIADFIDRENGEPVAQTEAQLRTGTGSLDPLLTLLIFASVMAFLRSRRRIGVVR